MKIISHLFFHCLQGYVLERLLPLLDIEEANSEPKASVFFNAFATAMSWLDIPRPYLIPAEAHAKLMKPPCGAKAEFPKSCHRNCPKVHWFLGFGLGSWSWTLKTSQSKRYLECTVKTGQRWIRITDTTFQPRCFQLQLLGCSRIEIWTGTGETKLCKETGNIKSDSLSRKNWRRSWKTKTWYPSPNCRYCRILDGWVCGRVLVMVFAWHSCVRQGCSSVTSDGKASLRSSYSHRAGFERPAQQAHSPLC